jgi:hypothetical protein
MENNMKIFTHAVTVSGNLLSTFEFTSKIAVDEWIAVKLPLLEKQYGKLEYIIWKLPPLKIGDTCYVSGEGVDEFKIRELINFSEDRWGFVLDSGWREEVWKCYFVM